MFNNSRLRSPRLIAPLAGILAALPLIASAAPPTDVELARAWQTRYDAMHQAALKEPRKADPLGYRVSRTYTKVRATACHQQSENETFCVCDVWYTQEGSLKKDGGAISMLKMGGQWVMKPN